VGEVVDEALDILAAESYDREKVLEVKDKLDIINNLEGSESSKGKVGLPGWTIKVTDSFGVEWTTTTNDTGYWQLCGLAPGNYTVCEVPQTGWTAVEPESGCCNVTLDGVNQTNINFKNAKTELACISGYKLNESDVGLEGWTIKVKNSTDAIVGSNVTNATGYWLVCGLPDGNYTVCEKLEDGWTTIEPESGCQNVQVDGMDVTDVNFTNTELTSSGTGTPGYWKNHPEAWPVDNITIGNVTYTKDEAIEIMKGHKRRDKTYTMFSALVAAKLNVLIGNDAWCIKDTITAADAWMATYGPVGSGVKGKSSAWRKEGEPLYEKLDDYNNGLLCAPSRG